MEGPKKSKKWIWIALTAVLVCAIAAVVVVFQMNTYYLELNIPEETITLEYGVDEMPEVTALCKGTIINKEGTPVKTTIEGELNLDKLGVYNVNYVATYKNIELSENRTIEILDTQAPVIELVSDPEHFTSPVAEYEEEGFTATDNYDGDLTSQVVREEKDGIVTYYVVDSTGNEATVERTIVYKDVVAPVITLEDGTDTVANLGDTYKDPGYKASDDVDGDITNAVKVEGKVDGKTKGSYTLTYSVSDSSGNICEIKRKVEVKDIKAPSISLKGSKDATIKLGETYTDPGYSASDNIDGDLTDQVSVSGKVDTSKVGSYTITYKVTDSSGNSTTAKRSVFVYKKQAVANTQNPGKKVVYLTFDDGPSKYTETLLNVLDKYGVKATFFVTNQFPAYKNMIGETYRRGHTIALHTYTHNYSKIYKSEEAYYSDLQKIQDLVVAQTGVEATIVRFPGGTSNAISKRYCPGIMTSLSKNLQYHGYFYCDWNVSSGDAGETTSTAQVVKNVISGIKRNNISVVLQHDITNYSVSAVEDIIQWGMENGYTFLAMDETTPMVHHSPNN